MSEPFSSAGTGRLAQLLDALGSGLIEVVCAPGGLDTPVAEPVIFDALGESAAAGDLLLAVGVDVGSSAAFTVIEAARHARACAVVFKANGVVPEAVGQAAESAQVTVLAVPPNTAWAQLLTLLRTARGALNTTDTTPGTGLRVDDLFGLANAIAATLGGATTIEDLQSNVLAYSTLEQPIDRPRQATILGRRVPPAWSRALDHEGVFRQLFAGSDVVHVPGGTRASEELGAQPHLKLRPRLAIAVRAGGEPLGSIWVIQGAEPFTPAAEHALRSAAQIAAMHMLHHRSGADLERQRRTELLQTILSGGPTRFAATSALHFSAGSALSVLAFMVDPGDEDDDDLAVVLERLAAQLTLHVEAYRRHAYVARIDQTVYLVWENPDAHKHLRLHSVAEQHRTRLERSCKRTVRVGIGTAVTDIRELHRSRQCADQVLRVVRHRDLRTGHVEDLRAAIALLRLHDMMAQDPDLRLGAVSRLATHDAEKGTSHIQTLRAYLDNFGDVVAASAALHIHRNTFRYRLARLLEVGQLDLTNPEDRVIAHLQLQALDQLGHPVSSS